MTKSAELLLPTDGTTMPSGERPAALEIEGVRKYFTRRGGDRVPAVDGVSLRVEQGEFVVLLGPSGCGKTTLLRCIAGLENPDNGRIKIQGQLHFDATTGLETPPDKRNLGMVFQSYALWPHLKVYANVAYPLKLRKAPKSQIRERVMTMLDLVGVADLADQYPGQLSGGQQQRVALARALVSNNGLVLFDEPLSNVDAKVREQLRIEILRMQSEIGFAAIYVTHDQDEALELADRIAVLDSGKVAQVDEPQAVYERPSGLYVARFVGATNEIPGRVVSVEGSSSVSVQTEAGALQVTPGSEGLAPGDNVMVAIRPERIVLNVSPSGVQQPNSWDAEIVSWVFRGDHRRVEVEVAGWGRLLINIDHEVRLERGAAARITVPPEYARAFAMSAIGVNDD